MPADLGRRLAGRSISFLTEVHDGLPARTVEQAGFKGIWASGLLISTSLGMRDCSVVSWTEVLELLFSLMGYDELARAQARYVGRV